jgi:TPR repeat protein
MHSCLKILSAFLVVTFMLQPGASQGADPLPLENGKPVSGVIKGSTVQRYTIKAAKGASFLLTIRATGTPAKGYMPGFNLLNPKNQLALGGSRPSLYREYVFKADEGNWTVEVNRGDGGEEGGDYELSLLMAPGIKGKEIKIGEKISGTLRRDSIDIYTVRGEKDYTAQWNLTWPETRGVIIETAVISPTGMSDGNSGCGMSCENMLAMPETGFYTVLVWRSDSNDIPIDYSYTVNWGNGQDPPLWFVSENAARIDNGQVVTGTISGAKTDRYMFDVKPGSHFIVSLSEKGPHTPSFIPSLRLKSPDNRIAEGGAQEFFVTSKVLEAAGGQWTAEVGSMSGSRDVAGNYELKLVQIPGAAGTKMKFGQLYGSKVPRGGLDVYTISGTPGLDAVLDIVPEVNPGFAVETLIFSPSGAMIDGAGSTERYYHNLQMSEPGNYTVVVLRQYGNDDTPGNYSIFVKRKGSNNPEPAASPGQDPAYAAYLAEQEEQKKMLAQKVLESSGAAFWLDRIKPPIRAAHVYRKGMFLQISPIFDLYMALHDESDAGNMRASLMLGDKEGPSRHNRYWIKAAAAGSVDAVNRLGMAAEKANEKDVSYKSAEWYRRIVQQAVFDPATLEAENQVSAIWEPAKAVPLYRAAAERGSATSQFNLGVFNQIGFGTPVNDAEAAKWYAKAAAQNLSVAQNALGELYEHGQGVARDDTKAAALYEKAAQSGYPQALYNLGRMAAAGRGMTKDPAKAADMLGKAAAEGHADARAELLLLQEKTVDAMNLWRQMASDGNPVSLRKLTESYRTTGVPPADAAAVLEIYRKAAQNVNPVVFSALGDFFAKREDAEPAEAYFWYLLVNDLMKGSDVPPDTAKELAQYAKAEAAKIEKTLSAEQVAVAKWRIRELHPQVFSKEQLAAAETYLRASKLWDEGDQASALDFYLQAAGKGVARASLELANFFQNGMGGLSPDIPEAIKHYRRAIRGGLVGPATRIGWLYQFGIGVPYDVQEAAKWYALDASRGNVEATERLGWIYLYATKDGHKKALAHFEKQAAVEGGTAALNTLGMMYAYGLGVPKDEKTALKWYLKSADRGNPVAENQAAALLRKAGDNALAFKLVRRTLTAESYNNLAFMYEHKLDPPLKKNDSGQSRRPAIELYKAASDMCYARAMYNIGRLYETGADDPAIAPKPIAKNPELARKWMESAAQYGSKGARIWLVLRSGGKSVPGLELPVEEVEYRNEPCNKKAAQP